MYAKSKGPHACFDCGSALVEQDGTLHHDQYKRHVEPPYALDENRPLPCKWAGLRFELPVVDLKQFVVKG